MVGRAAVCRHSLRNGASRRHPCLNAFLSLVSTDTLQCCFSAAVSLQVITEPFDLAEELPTGMVGAVSKSGACGRAQFACTLVFHRFKRVLAYAGVRALLLACLLLLSARR